MNIIEYFSSVRRRLKLYKHRNYIKSLVKRGLKLGKNVTIATTANIDDEYAYLISIGNNCTISNRVRLLAHDATTYKFTDSYTRIGKVQIKDNCYFGENVIVLPGVTIGPNVLVAAGSVVNKDIPENSCVAGVPARFYAKFDEFLENQKAKIKSSQIVQFEDIYFNLNNELKNKLIKSVDGADVYVQGYRGKFPTNFNVEEINFGGNIGEIDKQNDFSKVHPWMFNYLVNKAKNIFDYNVNAPKHIFLCICDHFEPLGGGASYEAGLNRIKFWCEKYPEIAKKYKDSDGFLPKYTFFYPQEEYREEYLDLLADLCKKGFGEVEVHLHHDNDNSENLRNKLIDFKQILVNKHGLLSKDKNTGEIKYGFVHGNWALDNSRPDGRWCGVNNEISILQETGCYADFTMPSAPDITQTTKINSIYYAVDNPNKPKSHNYGKNAEKGKNNQQGLLMVQGPLMLNWKYRKWGVIPHIENSFIGYDYPVTFERIKLWCKVNIHIINKPDFLFVKLYTHGCQEKNMEYLFDDGLDTLFSILKDNCNNGSKYNLHYVTAREMVNVIKAIEDNCLSQDVKELIDYRYFVHYK